MWLLGEIRALLEESIQTTYPKEEAKFLALDLLGEVLGKSRTQILMLDPREEIRDKEEEKILGYLKQLLAGEPFQYIVGRSQFGDLCLKVGEGVLIPRPETEELVAMIAQEWRGKESCSFLDIGTGSGCIPLYLMHTIKRARGYALEKSSKAIEIASYNFDTLLSSERKKCLKLIKGDMTQAEGWLGELEELDLIVSNPPYVDPKEYKSMATYVRDKEPHMALFSPEEDPLYFYREIASLCHLLPTHKGAMLYLEINSALGLETKEVFEKDKLFTDVILLKDLSGRNRFIKATIVKK